MTQPTRRAWLRAGATALAGTALGTRLIPGHLAAAGGEAPAVIRLSLNENPLGPSPRVIDAIGKAVSSLHRYVDEEAAALTAQVAAQEGVDPSQIILGEVLEPLGLNLGLRSGAGGEFVYSVPGYPALVNAAARVGGRVVAVPLDERLGNDLPALADAVTPRTQAVFVVNPHNPSGTVNGVSDFLAFVRSTARRGPLVVVDEAYLEYTDSFYARTAVPLVSAGENVAVFRTFGKVYGLAALPMGYLVAPRELATYLRGQGVGQPRDLNRLAAVAAGAALADQPFVERVRSTVAEERALWHAELSRLGLRHTRSEANFVYFETPRPATELTQALRASGIVVGRVFPPYDRWVRITIGLRSENVRARAALQRILGA